MGVDGTSREREFPDSICDSDGPETLCGGCLWDTYHDYEQMEALTHGVRSTCQLGFEKVRENGLPVISGSLSWQDMG